MTDDHIGETTLAAMVLQAAQSIVPDIARVSLRFAGSGEANWEVAGITFGRADHEAASVAVAEAVAIYRIFWIMVPDGDPRDEQKVGPLTLEELSRWRAQIGRDP